MPTIDVPEETVAEVHPSNVADDGAGSFKRGRHVRVWKLDALTGAVAAQFLYPLDEPASFQSDQAAGEVGLTDVKVCEAAGPYRVAKRGNADRMVEDHCDRCVLFSFAGELGPISGDGSI